MRPLAPTQLSSPSAAAAPELPEVDAQPKRPAMGPAPELAATAALFPARPNPAFGGTTIRDPRLQFSGAPLEELDEFNAAPAVTPELAAKGYVANVIAVRLSGNMHFADWFKVVQDDASAVVAVGDAYSGRTVKVGREIFSDAALVHFKKRSGFAHDAEITVLGKPGDAVELRYVRLVGPVSIRSPGSGAPATAASSDLEILSGAGMYAATREDPYFRIARAEVVPTSPDGPRVATRLEHFSYDPYGNNQPALDPPGKNEMGGGASAEKAATESYEPVLGFINAR